MTVFLTSIQSIIPIIVIIALGYILQLKGWFSESFGPNLSRLIMNVALPVSIFVSVLKYLTVDKLISLSGGLLYTFGAFALTYIFGFLAVKLCGVRAGRRGTMINTFVNANTIFIGLPLNIALFGEVALPYFLIYYITNTISTWALGVYIMTSDRVGGKKKEGTKFDWKKLLPAPLVGFLIALVFLLLGISVPAFAENTLTYIGNIVTPLSLIYIGIILAKAGLKSIHLDKDTVVAVVGRFILARHHVCFTFPYRKRTANKGIQYLCDSVGYTGSCGSPHFGQPRRRRCRVFHQCGDHQHRAFYSRCADSYDFVGLSVSIIH